LGVGLVRLGEQLEAGRHPGSDVVLVDLGARQGAGIGVGEHAGLDVFLQRQAYARVYGRTLLPTKAYLWP
jgi:hypothetical protein